MESNQRLLFYTTRNGNRKHFVIKSTNLLALSSCVIACVNYRKLNLKAQRLYL